MVKKCQKEGENGKKQKGKMVQKLKEKGKMVKNWGKKGKMVKNWEKW